MWRYQHSLFLLFSTTSSDNQLPVSLMKAEPLRTVSKGCLPQVTRPPQASSIVSGGTSFAAKDQPKDNLPAQLAVRLKTVAIEGLTDEELSDSGGEGMYRERDEFVVRNEDIDLLKVPPEARCVVSDGRTHTCSLVHPGDHERGQRTSSPLESSEGSAAEICAGIKRWQEGLLSHQQRKPAPVSIPSLSSRLIPK